MNRQIDNYISSWEAGLPIKSNESKQIYEEIDSYLEEKFEKIIANPDPEKSLAELVQLTNFFSAASMHVPGIISKLQNAITKFMQYIKNIGQKLGANSISIAVSFTGVSLSLTWKI